jgi:hypothetical protein
LVSTARWRTRPLEWSIALDRLVQQQVDWHGLQAKNDKYP